MRRLQACWRLARGLLQLVRGALVCLFIFPFLDPAQRMRRVQQWSGRVLQVLGVTVQTHGVPQAAPVLMVANHVSWLDILAINAVCPARFVSKAEVHRWPLIGWLVACGGTLFIERDRKRDALRVVHQVAEALTRGDRVAVFPEGTTSDGAGLLPFHANLLQAAVSSSASVQPVALRFSDAKQAISRAAAYVGNINLVQSVWAIVNAECLVVRVSLLEAETAGGRERRELSETLRSRLLRSLS